MEVYRDEEKLDNIIIFGEKNIEEISQLYQLNKINDHIFYRNIDGVFVIMEHFKKYNSGLFTIYPGEYKITGSNNYTEGFELKHALIDDIKEMKLIRGGDLVNTILDIVSEISGYCKSSGSLIRPYYQYRDRKSSIYLSMNIAPTPDNIKEWAEVFFSLAVNTSRIRYKIKNEEISLNKKIERVSFSDLMNDPTLEYIS